ncbi:aldehyde dehydrogenase family protein [Galbibacter sp. BG1]|uniref:aldehyde dehydrogenase family protein n=1 Tax=Galbibacter sp. BG1 TaxID=1170699 RepID=UPI0015BFD470|nr:aldehyde dehydrogenase family protein [Galbibacter sp. BG1]QLE02452.1 aldehyde dehydrogenase family protein [Galbibacter sp. BG1]
MNQFSLPDKPHQYQNFINGTYKTSISNKTFERESPGHGVTVGKYPLSTKEDTEEAITAAKVAFKSEKWSSLTGADREIIIRKAAGIIRARKKELALIETLESGKPISQALDEMEWAAGIWDYAATLARHIAGDVNTNVGSDMTAMMQKVPIGVVGMITPWNFPLLIISQKLPIALAAGCTAVIKPSEMTPGTTLLLGEILKEAGLPNGVVNIVAGYGDPVGVTLTESLDVDMISFTGSTEVGKQIVKSASVNLKKVELELGGKNPQIIFPDADIDALIDAIVFGVYFNMGECCNSGSRIIVHEDIAEEIENRVIEHSKDVKVGDPLDPSVKIGAIINKNQYDKIINCINSGIAQGAELKLGKDSGIDDNGFYISPTIFTKVQPHMDIAKEEIFGPVLSILTFKTAEEAIEIANNTPYGLSAGVWTKDLDTAMLMTRKIEAGTVWVNNWMSGYPEIPFGGMKQSGLGRELGPHSIDEYMETKSVLIKMGAKPGNWVKG